jgi:xylulokinase
MAIYAGIDCGTQSTKVILIDSQRGVILAEGQAPHQLISHDNGAREQDPQWWIDALVSAFHQAVASAGIDSHSIAGISVSGQQHGLVALDKNGRVLLPAKLWCDTETAPQNADFVAALGGDYACLSKLGLLVQTGYTASKILWLKQTHPELYRQLDSVLLPHDYLNFWLTGERVAECGDASGTGLLDVRSRQWSRDAVNAIDDSEHLWQALPTLINARDMVGTVRAEVAQLLGLNDKVFVASGGGDNMMGAIGTGNISPGVVTMSLGTSGTLYAFNDQPMTAANPLLAGFCSSTGGWLPLICTMNMTAASSLVQDLFKLDLAEFNQRLEEAPIGAQGVRMLPFFNGERVPNLPLASGSIHNLNSNNFTQANLCRAVVESASFGLRFGLDLLRDSGVKVTQVRLIGGGSNSPVWRQMIANIMGVEVVCPVEGEAAALGAAIQAAWCIDERMPLSHWCNRFVALDPTRSATPEPLQVAQYNPIYQDYLQELQRQYPLLEIQNRK